MIPRVEDVRNVMSLVGIVVLCLYVAEKSYKAGVKKGEEKR